MRLFQDRLFALALAWTGDVAAARAAVVDALVLGLADLGVLTDANQVPAFLAGRLRRLARLRGEVEPDLAPLFSLRREEERAVALLFELAHLDEARAAELLDLPPATVANRLHAARRGLGRRAWAGLASLAPRLPSRDGGALEGDVLDRV